MSFFTSSAPVNIVLLTDESIGRATICNRFLNDLIRSQFIVSRPRNICHLSIIGFGNSSHVVCSGFLEDLYNNPIRVEKRTQKVSDGIGGLVDVTVGRPFWVESIDRRIEGDSLHHFLLDSITMIRDLIFERRNLPSIVLDAGCNFAKLNIEAKSYFTNSIVFGLVDNADAVVCRNKSYNSFRNNGKQYRSGELGGLLETGIGTIQNFRSFIDMIRHDEISLASLHMEL